MSFQLTAMLIGIDASRAEIAHKTGVERYSFELIKALRSTRPDHTRVILYSRVPLPMGLGPYDATWENRVLRWPFRCLWTQLRLSWEMLVHRPDVLFVPSAALPRIIPKQTVTTIHDASFVSNPDLYSWWQRVTLPFGLWDARRVAAVIVPSGFAKSQLKGRIGNVAVIPLGVSLPATSYTPPSTPYFLVVGRVDKKKNLKVIIDAFGMMKVRRFGRTPTAVGDQSSGNQAKLFFAGKFGFGAEEIIKNAQRSGAIKDIEFMGAVSDQELSALYRGAQALLHPCPVEGFGLPVIEAMSQGLAVIVSNVGAAAEAAGEAAIKVDPHDPEVWVRAMEQSFDPGVRNSLVEQGRMRAAEFTWQSAALNTWQILMK